MRSFLPRLVIAAIAIVLSIVSATGADEPEPGAKLNRLAKAASPYLRQHATNPVDWYTWGPEAFEKARRENKPIFLSVGYATCYWCHVMARESFANGEIAKLLNAHTVPVKVDRERRPDVDATYMLATELITQQGGWPNSVLLTPDLKPFYGFGYVPREQLSEIITQVATGWREQRDVIKADATRIADLIQRAMNRRADAVPISKVVMRRASLAMLSGFDVANGGIGAAPKFPQENIILFLLHRAERDGDQVSREAALLMLDAIIRGGIHDHVAGGFHRYATDAAWAVPHFEKMLYNQALLTRALAKAYQLTGADRYARAAKAAISFVLTEMMTSSGGLASAFDAETDGVEGVFYLWSEQQFRDALGADADFAAAIFGVTKEGNHEGKNTLRLVASRAELAAARKMKLVDFDARLEAVRAKLRAARQQRKPLIRDDKVLAGWNALMVRALTEAGVAFAEPRYLSAAEKIQSALMQRLRESDGTLRRAFFDGKTYLEATQADYAFTALAALALYDATSKKEWLDDAERFARTMVERFADEKDGGFFMSRARTGFTHVKDQDDSTIPSGNGAALEVFARLGQRSRDVFWKQQMLAQQAFVSGLAAREPRAHAATLIAADIAERGDGGAIPSALYGTVRLNLTRLGDQARIRIKLAPGWHINSTKPRQDFLVPTKISVNDAGAEAVSYPSPIERKLGFHNEPLSLYEGTVDVMVQLPPGDEHDAAHRVRLDLQACSDEICLEPQVVRAIIPALSQRRCHLSSTPLRSTVKQ